MSVQGKTNIQIIKSSYTVHRTHTGGYYQQCGEKWPHCAHI